jgi:hypothetical protein
LKPFRQGLSRVGFDLLGRFVMGVGRHRNLEESDWNAFW